MKKKFIIIAIIAAILAGGGFVAYKYVLPRFTSSQPADDGNSVYVTKVSDIVGSSNAFAGNRYSGVVETQEVVAVKADSDKTIKDTYVEAGDNVKKGDKLFEYDVEEMKTQLSQTQLDLEQTQSEITSYNNQIASLEKERNALSANETNQQLSLTNQIEALKLELKKADYTVETKKKDIEKLKKSINTCVVKSTVDGKVQSVGENSQTTAQNSGYINIATEGDYRIKALVSEENVQMLYEGADILIRSRTDDKTWTGKISSIDTAAPDSSANNGMTETTTKYPVYIDLDSTEGLLVGQHVTVELNMGQTEVREGLWLDDFYISSADENPYVWCDSNGKLEKRSIQLGQYDEEMMRYEILSGLAEEDYIAFPEERLTEGMPTIDIMDAAADMKGNVDYGDDAVGGGAVDGGGVIVDENGNVIDMDGDNVNIGDDGTVAYTEEAVG